MRKQIRKWDDPILEEMCEPVDLSDPNQRMEVAALVDRMKKILLATKDGVGLAAPQVGSTKQVLVYRTSLESKDFTVMINPLLVDIRVMRQLLKDINKLLLIGSLYLIKMKAKRLKVGRQSFSNMRQIIWLENVQLEEFGVVLLD